MSNVLSLAKAGLNAAANERCESQRGRSVVSEVFIALHGFYGVLFSSKFSTGEVDERGKDKGVLSAKKVWSSELAKYDFETVSAAVHACKTEHPKYPPSLPEFLELCEARKPRGARVNAANILPRIEHKALSSDFVPLHDGKDWARRIMGRYERGERINPTTLKMAKEVAERHPR